VEEEWVHVYEAHDQSGAVLRFSFHSLDGSVQTELNIGGHTLVTVVHESCRRMWIANEKGISQLCCDFQGSKDVQLRLSIRPRLIVNWSGLRKS
jgi:hypothetical protein